MKIELPRVDFCELGAYIKAKQDKILNIVLALGGFLFTLVVWYLFDAVLLKYALLIVFTFVSLSFFKKSFQINEYLKLFRKENENFLNLIDEDLLREYYYQAMATECVNEEEYAQWAYNKMLKQLNSLASNR